jgi:hypothetical protein
MVEDLSNKGDIKYGNDNNEGDMEHDNNNNEDDNKDNNNHDSETSELPSLEEIFRKKRYREGDGISVE